MAETKKMCKLCPDDAARKELVEVAYQTLGEDAPIHPRGPKESHTHWFCPSCDGGALEIALKRGR